jgi:uroporphyrinogen III methyltransferase / synthase
MAQGVVYLVGAGPGDPGLLTLRGRECLGMADLVLYDYLANPRLLQYCQKQAELVCLGHHRRSLSGKGSSGRLMPQDEVQARMIEAAQAGQTVVRLKGGDPAIFGHLAEESEALQAAGIEYEIVPGITAALAVGSHAGIPLTHRRLASCVAFVTGQQIPEEQPPNTLAQPLDFSGLANFPGTLVFYMGVTTAPRWTAALIEQGKPANTPVAIIRQCSLPRQMILRTTLGQLVDELVRQKFRPPAIAIVGEVASHHVAYEWFATRPLFGKTVLISRPEHQAESMIERLTRLGAEIICQPAIQITPPAHWDKVDSTIEHIGSFDWIVFSSTNGVQYFIKRILQTGHDLRILGNARLAAIGPATADALSEYYLQADLQPEEYRAEALAEALVADTGTTAGAMRRMLLIRASRGREYLAEKLTAAGIQVEQTVVYHSSDLAETDPEVNQLMAAGRIDWVTATSSAIASSMLRQYGQTLRRTQVAAISPLTASVFSAAGYPQPTVASQYTTDGLIDAIVQAEGKEAGRGGGVKQGGAGDI